MTMIHSAYPINRVEAASLAELLHEAGYTQVSRERCNDYVCNVVRFFAGSDPLAQYEVRSLICEACGFEAADE